MNSTTSACGLCRRSAREVRFRLLVDVSEADLAEWTFNIISLKERNHQQQQKHQAPHKLCTKCCRDVSLLGELLFKWRSEIRISLESAAETAGRNGDAANVAANDAFALNLAKNGSRSSSVGNIRNAIKNIIGKNGGSEEEEEEELEMEEEEQQQQETHDDVIDVSDDEECQILEEVTKPTDGGIDEREQFARDEEIRRQIRAKGFAGRKPEGDDESVLCLTCGEMCTSAKCRKAQKKAKAKAHKKAGRTDVGDESGFVLCELCSIELPDEKQLKKHLKNHSKARLAFMSEHGVTAAGGTCPQCDKSFVQLKQHMRRMHSDTGPGAKEFLCDSCPKAFRFKRGLAEHARIHTGEKPYTCNVCDSKFRCLAFLRNHRTTHTGEKKYGCKFCPKTFRTFNNRDTHQRIVHKSVQFLCPKNCGRQFIRQKHVTAHALECVGV